MKDFKSILAKIPIRRTREQKSQFIDYIKKVSSDLGCSCTVESDGKKRNENRNIVVGDIYKAKVICTAHYDTASRSLIPQALINNSLFLFVVSLICMFATAFLVPLINGGLISVLISILLIAIFFAMPIFTLIIVIYAMLKIVIIWFSDKFTGSKFMSNPNNANDNSSGVFTLLTIMNELNKEYKNKVAFVFFDNEERRLKGSKFFKKEHFNNKHDINNNVLIVNFDCVTNGDYLYASCKSISDTEKDMLRLNFKDIKFFKKAKLFSTSDHKCFNRSIGIIAYKRLCGILYISNIHTIHDKPVDGYNDQIENISRCAINFIADLDNLNCYNT